jgi:hypothetical protein
MKKIQNPQAMPESFASDLICALFITLLHDNNTNNNNKYNVTYLKAN